MVVLSAGNAGHDRGFTLAGMGSMVSETAATVVHARTCVVVAMNAPTNPKPDFRIQRDRENWMVEKLYELVKTNVRSGLTTLEQRREHIRKIILENGLADIVIGRPSGQPVTWSSYFERTYGVPLAVEVQPQAMLL